MNTKYNGNWKFSYERQKNKLNSSRRVATLGDFFESKSSSAWVDNK